MNAWEKTVDLVMAVLILFMIPLLYYGGGRQVSQALLAGKAGERFLRCVATEGEITLPVWRELEHALEGIGCDGFELTRERFLYEPYGEEGETAECAYVKGTEEIREQVEGTGYVLLQAGDRVWLNVSVNGTSAVYFHCVRTGGIP